jgi:prepilin-type processing-associated H-X9-DG protein
MDYAAGRYTVLSLQNQPVCDASTISYAGCFGASRALIHTPEQGDGLLYRNSQVRLTDITDGTSTTMAVGERPALLAKGPWVGAITGGTIRTTPGAPVLRSIVHPPAIMVLARIGGRPLMNPLAEPYDFFSAHPGVVPFLFADGSVRMVPISTSLPVLQALATRAGGEAISGSDF